MRKIIVVIIVAMISSFSYYGAVNEKGEKVVDLTTNIQEENVVENESVEETQGNIGVRIDIWTHLMRECIINYVH